MAKLRWLRTLFAQWDDGAAMGISGVEPDANLEDILGRERPVDPVFDVDQGADVQTRGIPGWALWTEAEVLDWIAANVAPEIETIAPETYSMLWRMARMIVALRNKVWPELEGNL